MKDLIANVMVFLVGCNWTVPPGLDMFEVTASVYERGIAVSGLRLGVLPSVAFTAERSYRAPERLSVWLALEMNQGEPPDTVRVAGSMHVNDGVAEPEITLIPGTSSDFELDGADRIVCMSVNSAWAGTGMALRGSLSRRAVVLTRTGTGP